MAYIGGKSADFSSEKIGGVSWGVTPNDFPPISHQFPTDFRVGESWWDSSFGGN